MTILLILFKLVVGYLLGTLAEYWVHRGLHVVPVLRTWHQKHHDKPDDYTVGGSWLTHALTLAVIFVVLGWLLSLWVALGFMLWYGVYSALHYYSHQVQASKPHLIDFIQDTHIEHHVTPNKNFSVSFPVWDMVFGTYVKAANRNRE